MHIGLIGGIGPAATDFYYRRLISSFAARKALLDLTIGHADAPTLLANLAAGNVEAQVSVYQDVTERLARAGADCVVVTSIAGHFCIEAFKAVSPLPVVDMIAEVERAIASRGFSRIGILGTRTVMETRFYGAITSTTLVPPPEPALSAVHQAYADMATAGQVTGAQREVFDAASRDLMTKGGTEAIMLGGTDLALVYDEASAPFPLIDCAAIHVDAVVRQALG